MAWTVEFFEDDTGRQPAREWILSLDARKRAAVIAAVETILVEFGLGVCNTEHGKQLGDGLFELRIRHEESVLRRKAGQSVEDASAGRGQEVLLRVFCHAYGDRIVLLLGGYDKGAAPGKRRQEREIQLARRRLRSFRLRRRRQHAGSRRRR